MSERPRYRYCTLTTLQSVGDCPAVEVDTEISGGQSCIAQLSGMPRLTRSESCGDPDIAFDLREAVQLPSFELEAVGSVPTRELSPLLIGFATCP
ncbi:hypothetical protein [Janibacter hoylei]|uniref:hypothetical protein n=1 Tax=Janibacter hoylei TaxID=364298 RepID=UPI00249339BE|nr:hypothetical protein [Janibacter hoylei]